MKKFYALAIAAFALTASAQGIQANYSLNPVKAKSEKMVRPAAPLRAASAVKPTAAPTLAEVEGIYVWEGYEFLTSGGQEVGESVSSINITAIEGNEVAVAFDYGTFTGTFDPATGNISLEPGQRCDIPWDGDVIVAEFQHVIWPEGSDEMYLSEDPLVLTYFNGGYETGVDDILSIEAFEDGAEAGYFHLSGYNVFTKYVEEIPEGWTEMGLFRYQDSWAINLFSVDPANFQYYVTVIKSDEDENVIRLLNPYTSPISQIFQQGINDNTTPGGVIEINIGNPDFIWLTGGLNSGFSFDQAEVEDMTCWNLEGYLKYNNPTASEDAIIENIVSNDLEVSDMVDDVITIRNTVFGMAEAPYAAYSWQNPQGQSVMTPAILWLAESASGINNVVADNENNINAPVVYYNLQGVQVADPRGGIFIRKQGNQATKVIIK